LSVPAEAGSGVTVTVFDILGREVGGPHVRCAAAGADPIRFGEKLVPGIYYVLARTSDSRAVAKAVKIR
jgi:hypothetical protein